MSTQPPPRTSPAPGAPSGKEFLRASAPPVIANRRLLPLASTAMALSLVGCNAKPPQEAVVDVHAKAAMAQTEDFASGWEKVDPIRLRAAMSGKPLPKVEAGATLAPAVAPTTQPDAPKVVVAVPATQPAVLEAPPETLMPGALTLMKGMAYEPLSAPPVAQAPAIVRPVEPTYDVALNVIRKQAIAHPSLNEALAVALLETSRGKAPTPGIAAGLSPADQKLYADLLDALQGMTVPASTSTLPERAAPLVDAARKWQSSDMDLSIPKVALASRVDSFGVYTPVEPKFPQGERRTVIIYCEVANFTAKRDAENAFETRLSQQESLITEDGLLAWRPNAEEVVDRSLNLRHDFYLVKKMTLPASLAAGKYTLRMTVTDHNSAKIAMASLPIEILENR